MVVRVEPQTPLASLIMSPQRAFLSTPPNDWIVIVDYIDGCSRNFPRIIRRRISPAINRMQILIVARISIRRARERTRLLLRRLTFRVIEPIPRVNKRTLLKAPLASVESCRALISRGENLVFISWRGWGPTVPDITNTAVFPY